MEKKQREKINEKKIEMAYLIGWSVFTYLWLYIQPLNSSPDEEMRYLIPEFIYQYGVLPHGADKAIMNGIWGSSYGFNPITSYIISAVFMKFTALFTTGDMALLISARLVSLLFGAANVWIVMKISERVFWEKWEYRWMFIVFATMIPEAIFICSYVNIDAMALFAATLTIYIWILGMESGWRYRHCIALGFSLSLCLLSYYNTYGFLVISFFLFVGCHFMDVEKKGWKKAVQKMIKGGLLVLLVVFLCSGWWFIRNYILYNGDILGMKTINMVAEEYALPEFKPSNRVTPMSQGMSFFAMLFQKRWITSTMGSFIARFGFSDIYIAGWMYLAVGLMFLYGLVGVTVHVGSFFVKNEDGKKKTLFHWMLLLSVLLTVGISAYYSYTSDYQPQGRYCLPMLSALAYFVTAGTQKLNEKWHLPKKTERSVVLCMISVMILISLLSYFIYFLPNYR